MLGFRHHCFRRRPAEQYPLLRLNFEYSSLHGAYTSSALWGELDVSTTGRSMPGGGLLFRASKTRRIAEFVSSENESESVGMGGRGIKLLLDGLLRSL